RPVRLLHAGHDPVGTRPADREAVAERGGDPRSARRQSLPLHRLRQDRRGSARRRSRRPVRLRAFALIQPDSVAEAIAALRDSGGGARVIAGGTALVPMMRLGLMRPDPVIALHRVSTLAEIRARDEGLSVGAMVTLADLHRAPVVRARWPLLAEAAGRVATPAIRSSATLGGNL